jgi:tRNA (guanine-N7-)-methyltransferase
LRHRNVTGAVEIINAHPFVTQNPGEFKGRWNELFGNNNPVHVEIGMGKGDFIIENAMRYPEINFIGMEKYSGILLGAARKLDKISERIPNLCLLRFDVAYLTDIFGAEEIDMIFINFPDPWKKERKAKFRLTHRKFLQIYYSVLKLKGFVQFKSDNDMLYEYTLGELEASNFKIINRSVDFHHSDYAEGNIMTGYELKFSTEGKNINYLLFQKQD